MVALPLGLFPGVVSLGLARPQRRPDAVSVVLVTLDMSVGLEPRSSISGSMPPG